MRDFGHAFFIYKGDLPMVDYKKLYIDLFNQVSKAIDILTNIQDETTDEFIKADPPPEEATEVIDRQKRPRSSAYTLK